jgi:hypothetical protein
MLVAFALLVGVGAAGAWWVRRPSVPEAVTTQTGPADDGASDPSSATGTPGPEPAARASQPPSRSDGPVALTDTVQQRTEPPAAAPPAAAPPAAASPAAASPSVVPAALFARAASLPSDQGLLMVVSDRSDTVYVDGRVLGDLTTLGPLTLTAGIHRVRVVTAGTDREADARVDAGQVRAIQFRFGATGRAR